jgi:hypothetical protein
MTSTEKHVWHYTPAYRARMILQAGHISPPTRHANASYNRLIWFSGNQVSEPTAAFSPSMAAAGLGFGCRFGLPASDNRLTRFTDAPMPDQLRSELTRSGRAAGANPREWWVMAGAAPVAGLLFQTRRIQRWENEPTEAFLASMAALDGVNIAMPSDYLPASMGAA